MELLRATLSSNLLAKRLERKLTQKEVASVAGVDASTYSRWESGKQWIDDPAKLEKIAEYYGVRATYFFFDHDLNELPPKPSAPSMKEITDRLEELIQFINK